MALFGCLAIGDEKVITIGGFNVITNRPYDDIFAFENSSWRSVGKLLTVFFLIFIIFFCLIYFASRNFTAQFTHSAENFFLYWAARGGNFEQLNIMICLILSPYNIERLEMDSGNGNVTENTVIYSDFRFEVLSYFF